MRRHGNYGRRLSNAERLEIRHRVARGETHAAVAGAVGCSIKSIQRLFVRTGGLLAGDSCRAIARRLGRSPSAVSPEVRQNGGRTGYRAWRAARRTVRQARRPRVAKLARCPGLRAEVERLLAERWSPQQIAHRLKLGSSF